MPKILRAAAIWAALPAAAAPRLATRSTPIARCTRSTPTSS
jgi:hypothetical protein